MKIKRLQRLKHYKNLKISIFLIFLIFQSFSYLYSERLQEIEVKAGDTLWGVANYYLKEPSKWPEILKFNNISADPHNVLPGTKLKIPVMLIKEKLRSSTMVSIIRKVKVRRQKEMDWNDAKNNMKLYNEDGVRTLENSYAGVKTPSGNLMTIGPLSLVIIQPEKKSDETRLLSGEIRASNIPIRTPSAFIMPRITPKTPSADYKAKVKEDLSTVVAVYKGLVDVTAKNKTVSVAEGFSTEVKLNQPPMLPKELPPTIKSSDDPEIMIKDVASKDTEKKVPEIKEVNVKNTGKPTSIKNTGDMNVNEINVGGELSRSGSSSGWIDITHYRIQIARDKEFNDTVFNSVRPIYEKFDIKKTKVPDGKYFWRVAYLDSSGAEGILSSAKIMLVDKTPPPLTIEEPPDNSKFSDKSISVKGITEPASAVDINGHYENVYEDGSFSAKVSIKKGENIIKINSKDEFGNLSTVSLKIYRTEEAAKQQISKKKGFFSTPMGIAVSVLTISVLLVISVVTVAG
ncbi:MAG: LysM peptidoglycan-binding domain-containing protein [Elusimicrobia bacterium]|nr:LysM peptidoglycan-binding domain-containing protein [Elusimicrobiota bacterium]